MRLYRSQIDHIAEDILRGLTKEGHIELADEDEARLDIVAVLKEFIRQDRKIVDEAKAQMERQGMSYSMLGKVKSQVAKERGFPEPGDQLPYLVGQLITMLFHSNNVEEIFCEDFVLRRFITKVVRDHTSSESELDREVRGKIRNLEQGTAAFEVEYQRVLESIKRRKHLED